ncbi:MAG: hypothetical protein LBO69_05415 [Ignavibacteria bacterium]|jgi:hypothetical protein|nr:hypothetical protein [Ignavibacteria bacterium]
MENITGCTTCSDNSNKTYTIEKLGNDVFLQIAILRDCDCAERKGACNECNDGVPDCFNDSAYKVLDMDCNALGCEKVTCLSDCKDCEEV